MRFNLLSILLLTSSLYAERTLHPWGKDADIHVQTPMPPQTSPSIAAKIGEKLILFHQDIISPVDGPRSHFRPTSSRYTLLAIRQYGLLKGVVMGCDRLMRENSDPWHYPTVTIDGALYKWDPVFTKTPPLAPNLTP